MPSERVATQVSERLKRMAMVVPAIRRLREQRDRLAGELAEAQSRCAVLEGALNQGAFPPGHFYSPIPDLDDVRSRASQIFRAHAATPGVRINAEHQLSRLSEFQRFAAEMPYPESGAVDGLRYRYDNDFFGHGDAVAYFCMLRSIAPRRIVEIGSGWSSALALDVDELFLGGATSMTFIEPYPDRLESLITDADRGRVRVVADALHDVETDVFDQLRSGDVLFVDSTHVGKIGSDVNQIMFEILPRLPSGVHVHIHDIFYPFEYPEQWVMEGRAWNELYLLHAFLIENNRFTINWFNSFLAQEHVDRVAAALPLWARNPGGSIWLEVG